MHSLLRAARQVETVSDLLLQTGIRSFSELLLMGSAEDVRNTALVTLAKRNGVSVDVLAALAPRELRARLAAVGNDQGVKDGFFDLVEVRCRATCALYSSFVIPSFLPRDFLPSFLLPFLTTRNPPHQARLGDHDGKALLLPSESGGRGARNGGFGGGGDTAAAAYNTGGIPIVQWGLLLGLPTESEVRASVIEELADVWGESEEFLREARIQDLVIRSIAEKDEL